jgi:hypothetical protein
MSTVGVIGRARSAAMCSLQAKRTLRSVKRSTRLDDPIADSVRLLG